MISSYCDDADANDGHGDGDEVDDGDCVQRLMMMIAMSKVVRVIVTVMMAMIMVVL